MISIGTIRNIYRNTFNNGECRSLTKDEMREFLGDKNSLILYIDDLIQDDGLWNDDLYSKDIEELEKLLELLG